MLSCCQKGLCIAAYNNKSIVPLVYTLAGGIVVEEFLQLDKMIPFELNFFLKSTCLATSLALKWTCNIWHAAVPELQMLPIHLTLCQLGLLKSPAFVKIKICRCYRCFIIKWRQAIDQFISGFTTSWSDCIYPLNGCY